MLEQDSYLLQNQMNPFPISGRLTLDDHGELSFRLDEKAAQASLGWLERAMGREGLKESILGGTAPVVFNLPVSGHKIRWPKLLGGYAMKFSTDDRTWIVSLNYPSGGGLWQMINMVRSGSTTKPWKHALDAAGAA